MDRDEILDELFINLLDLMRDTGVLVTETKARQILENELDKEIEAKDSSYDPAQEDNEYIKERATLIIIEEAGRERWLDAIREARENAYGSNVGWIYENMSDEIVKAAIGTIKTALTGQV